MGGNKYSVWSNQCRSLGDYELSCLGHSISIKTVINLSTLCNLITLPTHAAAFPVNELSPWLPPMGCSEASHQVVTVDYLELRAELCIIWIAQEV